MGPSPKLFSLKPIALAVATALVAPALVAQEEQTIDESKVENVYVLAERVVVRNHVNDTSPKLVYDEEFFQRFEPISVGDMLKRVPGITFNSDIGEYDVPRLRGLDSRYTQVLLNGRPIPGSENDGSIAVDRIPAEIIDRIEIVRSPSSDISSQGIGGTLNIILKDDAGYQGGFWRAGVVSADQTRGSGFVGVSGSSGNVDYGISLNVQERYNPKDKTSSEVEGDEREDTVESDVRDSRDVALDGDLKINLDSGDVISLHAYYLDTDREEEEDTLVSAFVREGDDADFELDEQVRETQLEEIEQQNISLSAEYDHIGRVLNSNFYIGWHEFTEDKDETNREADLGETPELDDIELTDIEDSELRLGFKSTYESAGFEFIFGGEYELRERDFAVAVFDDEGELDDEDDEFADFQAERNNADAFVVGRWQLSDSLEFEAGLRAEYTELTIDGVDFNNEVTSAEESELQLNPALHLRWHLAETDQVRVSLARTTRLPQFDQLNPVSLTIEDEIFQGDPSLEQEKSIGLDVGWDHFIDTSTVIGINLFYRQVSDLIEFNQVDVDIDGEEFELRTPINIDNDGTIYGAELDISAPATWLGLENLQWFVNYTYLESEVEDPFFEGVDRRFSGQAEYVYNLGFEHELPNLEFSYGLSYQQQGDAEEFEGNEVNRISYEGNLELFLEKRFAGGDYVLRLSGQNLLDAEVEELIREFDDADAFRRGEAETTEVEFENAEPAIVLTLRGRF